MRGCDIEAMKRLEEWRAQGKYRWFTMSASAREWSGTWVVTVGIVDNAVGSGVAGSLSGAVDDALKALPSELPVCETCGQALNQEKGDGDEKEGGA